MRAGVFGIRLATVVAALAATALVTPLHAQPELESISTRFADGWSAGDAAALMPDLLEEGIDLSLDGDAHAGVSRRQARAALDRFLGDWDPEEVEVRQAEVLGGQPQRALLEFTWAPTARGTPERRSFVIFVSLRRTLDQWCIEEIRVFS